MGGISLLRSLTHGWRIGLALLATALLVGVSIPRASAQLTLGTILGTVQDAQAAAIPGVSVSLVSETRGTKFPNVVSSTSGEFVFPNLPPDTYTLEIAQKGFKPLKRTGIAVSPGDRVGLGLLTLEIGTATETVTVTAESTLLQAQSAERSATITPTEVRNIPLLTRTFTNLIAVVPGVGGSASQPARVGDSSSYSGGNGNIMMDGVSTMDSGNNALAIAVNTESVEEIKIMVSNYQAEYGRQSGVQMSAVTKSGTNHFHGTGFMIMRQSGWNARNKTDILNFVPKAYLRQKDLGFTVGGPIGKPGHDNKLFFFYSHEFDPRTMTVTGGSQVNYRFPTALERQGDFSQTVDNNGNPYPYIKDPLSSSPCSASNTSGCFADGGVLGRIPANRQYALGLKWLSLFPMPNMTQTNLPYNYTGTLAPQNIMSQEPVMKIDYEPFQKLRISGKLTLWEQPATLQQGTLPGFNDTQVYKKWFYMVATTAAYSINPTTFVELTFGRTRNDLAGCFGPTNGVAPGFCVSSLPMDKVASLSGAGLSALPQLFPNSGTLSSSYYAYQAMQSLKPPIWDGTKMNLVPSVNSWGNRIANGPPNFPFPGWLNTNQNNDYVGSVTKVKGSHTLKAGLYVTHSYKAQQTLAGTWQGSVSFANDTNNTLDSGFGYANLALGVFDNYSQLNKYVEGNYVFTNVEGFIQDNWRVNSRLTLDYGVRLVHQPPQHDQLGQGVNWLPDKWSLSNAPLYYLPGCATTAPCSGSNRQAKNPVTGALLGPNTAVAIGTLVPGTGNALNGIYPSGTDPVPAGTYYWPALRPGPRFGFAYDVGGKQKLVLRGGAGLTFDRPSGNTVFSLISNPPNELSETLYYSQFQTMGGLTTSSAPNLNVYQLHSGLPSTWSWSGGAQYMLPQNIMLDVSYTGLHSYNIVEQVNVNTVDMGAAFLAANQDPTVTSALPGGAAVTQNMMRSIRGYGSLNMMLPRGFITSHTLQIAVNHRFSHGLQFDVNDTILIHRMADAGARIQHDANGNWSYRSDQDQANELFQDYIPTRHTLKGDLVYSIPAVKNQPVLHAVTRDWQLSGIWAANSPTAYTVGYSFQNGAGNQNITGSPDYGGRVTVKGNPGSGCNSGNIYNQFNTSAFAPPQVGSVGLESGVDYMRGCFYQQFDLALQREFRFGETRRLSFRLDAFNAFNQSHITTRNTTMTVASTTDPTIVNLPFDSSGNLLSSHLRPNTSGFGQVTGWQAARTLQAWLRFTF
ncbi:MAG TPA: carboxypeptidase-like regulatory domain-containing protein [Bryobacteraceae bacterium]|nr:carboxypeptidase-like regulatory domain-containing protein [Bryobacteraceae bacterium]